MINSRLVRMRSSRESGHQGIQTCHLCGKVQCGQRLGRVKCSLCSRIFCLQQLQRKFGITAVANDPDFRCPRCTGICCCVCNCQKPPPHVHCKVYKVRQNKVRVGDGSPAISQSPLVQTADSTIKAKEVPVVDPVREMYSQMKQEPLLKQERYAQMPMNPIPVPHVMDGMRGYESSVPRIPSMESYPLNPYCAEEPYRSSLDFRGWDMYPNSMSDGQTMWGYNVETPGSSIRHS